VLGGGLPKVASGLLSAKFLPGSNFYCIYTYMGHAVAFAAISLLQFSSVYLCIPTKHKILYQEYRDRKRRPQLSFTSLPHKFTQKN